MKVQCKKCGRIVSRDKRLLEKAASENNVPLNTYIENYLCRLCRPAKETVNIQDTISTRETSDTDIRDEKKSKRKRTSLFMTKKCSTCANSCKIYTISEKAILYCHRYTRRKESNDEHQQYQDSL